MTQTARPFRSVLYIPGSKERALEKAKTLPVDAIIFDLEDAVAPSAKPINNTTIEKRWTRRRPIFPVTSTWIYGKDNVKVFLHNSGEMAPELLIAV